MGFFMRALAQAPAACNAAPFQTLATDKDTLQCIKDTGFPLKTLVAVSTDKKRASKFCSKACTNYIAKIKKAFPAECTYNGAQLRKQFITPIELQCKSKKTTLIIAVLVAVLVIASAVAFFIWKKRRNAKAKNDTEAQYALHVDANKAGIQPDAQDVVHIDTATLVLSSEAGEAEGVRPSMAQFEPVPGCILCERQVPGHTHPRASEAPNAKASKSKSKSFFKTKKNKAAAKPAAAPAPAAAAAVPVAVPVAASVAAPAAAAAAAAPAPAPSTATKTVVKTVRVIGGPNGGTQTITSTGPAVAEPVAAPKPPKPAAKPSGIKTVIMIQGPDGDTQTITSGSTPPRARTSV